MEPPQHIRERCALYKAGTQKFLQWLTNAASCTAAHANAPLNDTISTIALLRLAATVAESTRIEIPVAMLKLLLRVISVRQECADWYKAQTTSCADSNRRHQYFIHTLRQIHQLLEGARQMRVASRRTAPTTSAKSGVEANATFSSRFAQLELEEPSESPLGAEPCPVFEQDELPQSSNIKITVEMDDDEVRRAAISTTLQQLHELRKDTQDIWCSYASGTVSFFVASAVTDFAFSLMRQADRALVAMYPELNDIRSIMWIVDLKWLGLKLANATLCAVEGLWMLMKEVHNARQNGVPTRRHSSNVSCPDHPFSEALMSAQGAVTKPMLDGVYNRSNVLDDFVHGCWHQFETKDRSISHVFACHTYMTMFDAIGNKADLGVVEFTKTVRQSRDSVDALELFCKRYERADGVQALEAIRRELAADFAVEDILSRKEGPESYISKILKNLPITLSAKLYTHRQFMHTIGIDTVNLGSAVLATAHFYRAARYYGLLTTAWDEMDWFIEAHSRKYPLVLPVANNADAFALYRRFEIAMGVPPSTLKISKKGAVKAREKALHISSKQMTQRRNDRRITTGSAFIEAYAAHATNGKSGRGLYPAVLASLHGADAESRGGKPSQPEPTALQLLQMYRETLVADEAQLTFDYLTFWSSCAKLMDEIREKILESLPANIQPLIKSEAALVIILLHIAASCKHASRPFGDGAFSQAVDMLEPFITEQNRLTHAAGLSQRAD